MSDYVLGVDIGTGSTKAVLTDIDGVIVASARADHQISLPQPGWAEMDAETLWWEEVRDLIKGLLESNPGMPPAAVCVSGLGPCVVQTNDELTPRRLAILYGIDSRATQESEELNDLFGADNILQRCGKDLSSQAVGPKLLWLRQEAGEAWSPTDRWFSAHNFVIAKLTGEWVLDHHTASQCDPFYDIAAQDWARDWVDEALPGLALPRLVWPMERVGVVTEAAANLTGLAAGTPVLGGTVDAWAEAFGAGVRRPGDLMLMYGSTMFFVQVLSAPTSHSGLWTTSGVQERSHTLAAGMSTSGSLTTWVQELTGGAPFEDLIAEASAVPPGAEGLVLLPYFAGERTPIYDPDARGVIAGLTLRHKRGHLMRAAYEGIACGIRQIVESLENTAGAPARIVAVGGGTQSALWTQIVSDVGGFVQEVPKETIGASYGDALMAAIGMGLVPPETDWARTERTITPDPETASTYRSVFRTYTELYPATSKQVHRLVASVRRTENQGSL